MIQLRPTIQLKIDKLSKDGICFRVFLWMVFYIVILLMSSSGARQYIEEPFIVKQDKNASHAIYNICHTFYLPVQEFDIEMKAITNLTALHEQGIIVNPPMAGQVKEIFPKMHYRINGYATKNNISNVQECNDQSKYDFALEGMSNELSLACAIDARTHKQTECIGHVQQIETMGFSSFSFQVMIESGDYTNGLQTLQFSAIFENNRYYSFTLQFTLVFCALIIHALYYLYSKLKDYPQQNWLRIHSWLKLLLIEMLLFNLPIQLLRKQDLSLAQMIIQLVELLLHTTLFYFWLDVFELQFKEKQEDYQSKSRLTIWNMFKLLLVACYTGPQAVMNLYVFYQKEEHQQYDPLKEIPHYEYYKQFQIGCLLIYSILYLTLFYQSFKQEKQVEVIQQQEKDIRQHDPFVEGQEIKVQETTEIRNYKALHILSLISFATLVYYQRTRLLYPHQASSQSTINESALLNIYLCIITQLYMPFQELIEDDKTNNVYGDIELEEQGNQVDRDNLWKNIQKQINEQNAQNSDDEEL